MEGGQKGSRPALTVGNVIKAVQGINWKKLAKIFRIPNSECLKIFHEYSTVEEREVAVVRYWLLRDPLASWRRIIDQLYWHGEFIRAESLHYFAEELTDFSLTQEHISEVVDTVEAKTLGYCLFIPASMSENISVKYYDNKEQKNHLIHYWVKTSPFASWNWLAGRLYYWNEKKALEAAMRYVQKVAESTFTLDNVTTILEGVHKYLEFSSNWLMIPQTELNMIEKRYTLVSQRKKACWEYWLKHHPALSWKAVAITLWNAQEYRSLEVLSSKSFLKLPGLDFQGKLDACRQVIQTKKAVDQIIMQGIFFGFPRSGKTSTKRRLVGKQVIMQQPSTGMAEKVSHIEIEKTTVHLSQLIWKEVTDLNEEAAMVVNNISNHIIITKEQSHDLDSMMMESDKTQSPTQETMDLWSTIVYRMKAIFERKKKTVNMSRLDTQQELLHKSSIDPIQLLESALRNTGILSQQGQDLRWILYLSDVGGQPEFQEMLPALVAGPSLYFVTFPLHKGLNQKCLVEYQCPDRGSIVPYTASFTMKEALLSSLASIASTRSYIKVDDGKAVYPKILFIGTHKDKLQSGQELAEIDKELQEAVKRTAAYRENMIEFHSQDQMVFDLDNTSDSEEDIQRVRNAVERIGTRNEDYRIQTPYTWMIFAITLRHQPNRVLSLDECAQIGQVCGIETREDLNSALWYLHHNVGVIRHFQDIPNLQDVVFIDPQYIFDKLTELIVNTFTFEAVGKHIHEEFIKKGIIPTSLLKKLSTESDDMDGDKFAVLLEHLNIIIPIEENEKIMKYFAPCALGHAELPPASISEKIIPPLRVTFESGYCPKGIFGSLIVKLLKKDKLSLFKWSLKEERIYRNQIYLSIGPYDSFEFSVFPMYINIALDTSIKHSRKIPLGSVCCDVRRELEISIQAVTEALHYTERATHSLAFTCPEPPLHDQSHAATINFSPDGTPCTLTCPVTRKCWELPDGHMFWFDENACLSVKLDNKDSTDLLTQSNYLATRDYDTVHAVPGLLPYPSFDTSAVKQVLQQLVLDSLTKGQVQCEGSGAIATDNKVTIEDVIAEAGISMNILEQKCSSQMLPSLGKFCVDWKLVGFHLKLSPAEIAAVDGDNRTVDEKRIGLLVKWRERFSIGATYQVLVQALLDCGRTSDAVDVCKAISPS